jgi:adenylate cyclase
MHDIEGADMAAAGRFAGFKEIAKLPPVTGGIIALLVITTLLLARGSGGLQFLDLATWDMFVSLRTASAVSSERLAVVTVTEDDIAALGSWPLTDAMLNRALSIIDEQGARVIGLDMYRDTPIPPGSDVLNETFSTNDRIFGVKKFASANAPGVRPHPLLEEAGRVGFSDVVVDANGIVRRGLLFLDDRNTVSYSLALQLALIYLAEEGVFPQPGEPDSSHIRLGEVTISPLERNDGPYFKADTAGYQFLLDYSDGKHGFPVVTLSELLNGNFPENFFRGKVIILGVSAESVKDIFFTPYNSGIGLDEGMAGVQVHALITSQLLHAGLDGIRPPHSVPESWELLWGLLWIVAGVGVGLSLVSFYRLFAVMLAGVAVIMATGYFAFTHAMWFSVMSPGLGWLASAGLMTAYLSRYERQQRGLLMNLFARHVSSDVADEIWRNREQYFTGGRLRSQKQNVTTLFSDIEHFTTISEKLDPESLMSWLNDYMEEMATLIMEHKGIVDDYYGDAIKGDFGVPVIRTTMEQERQDAENAVSCALAMRDRLITINERCIERGLPRLRMRVGICTGSVVAGCLGSSMRMKYTTIGDPVNTAARLESLDKQSFDSGHDTTDCRILISDTTHELLGNRFLLTLVGSFDLKGKEEQVQVYSVEGFADSTVVALHGRGVKL